MQYIPYIETRANSQYFADYSFKCFFLEQKSCISIHTSLKFVPEGCNSQWVITGPDSSLVSNRQQAISSTNEELTHWGWDKMANISQTTFWNACSWMKIYEFRLTFHKISLKFVPRVRINNIPSLVQIVAWRRPGDKPLSEPMMVNLLSDISITLPQWVKWWIVP